jgi:molybdate transport system substrate-binding protein
MQIERVARTAGVALATALALMTGCREPKTNPPHLTVFVAASMGDVLESLARDYQSLRGVQVDVSAAASSVLRKQIESGAACDVFISADMADMDKLADKQLIRAVSRRELARNQLVVVACDMKQRQWTGLDALARADAGRVALGDPAYVPAGRYARRALEAAGVWSAVEPRAVLADNVRVVCQYVRSGQADVGLVYATDAATMDGCRVLLEVDAAQSGPIVCPGAVCAQAADAAPAAAFLDFLTAPAQQEVWQKYGFRAPASGATP